VGRASRSCDLAQEQIKKETAEYLSKSLQKASNELFFANDGGKPNFILSR